MGYEAYERMVRSEDKEIIEALVDPGISFDLIYRMPTLIFY